MEEAAKAVEKYGILPFFTNSVDGFSLEETVTPDIWFTDKEGPWEWKGPLIRKRGFFYGKFFENKAAYVAPEWFLRLANYRRNGYDFDARYDDGLASRRDLDLYSLIAANAPVVSKKLRETGNYGKNGIKGFDTMITRLQMQCYVNINDFVYTLDKHGKPYGWGVGVYTTPELFAGEAFTKNVYKETPEESYEALFTHLRGLFPKESEKNLKTFLG